MIIPLHLSLLVALAAMAPAGCDAPVHHDALGANSAKQAAGDKQEASGPLHSIPIEYVWNGGARIRGATLYAAQGGAWLRGRLRASSFTMFAPSRVVRVEAVDETHHLLWSRTAAMKRDHQVGPRRLRTGTFRVQLPALEHVDHLHVGVAAKSDADGRLPETCLQGRAPATCEAER